MSLARGDHLVIKRDGKIVDGESYHEFEVMDQIPRIDYPETEDPDKRPYYVLKEMRVVK